MRLIDADELKKDDELTEWLTRDTIRTGKTLKAFSELFVKKIDDAPTVNAVSEEVYTREYNLRKDAEFKVYKLEKALEQEPCEDAQERYEDLCEYFGDAKDILKSRKDFKAWLERIKWHIRKAEELYEKYEHKQEPCECFTCKYGEWKRKGWDITMADDKCGGCCSWNNKYEPLEQKPKTGHWINIDDIESECSECGHREPNERFIFEDINFCAKCGAKMESESKT